MRLVERMTIGPPQCLTCGSGNNPENAPFIDLEADVNWGDPAYICTPCADKVAAIVGWITKDDKQSLEATISKRDREIHDLRAKLEARKRRLEASESRLTKIVEGSQTLKQEKVRRTKSAA